MAINNPGLEIPFGIQPTNPLPVDTWSGPFYGTTVANACAVALSSIPLAVRYQSMEVRLIANGQSYKYWFKDGVGNDKLVDLSILGATGFTGSTGATGFIGGTGATGFIGGTGATGFIGGTGATGASGIQGLRGATGASGLQGLQGSTGASGLQGATGASGIQGLTGATGASGIQGLQGSTGASGIQGATGASGIQGLQGATGASGIQGLQGTTGASGIQGLQGTTGASGIQGLRGATGASGVQGLQGATGASGIQGLTGATGSSGIQGLTGATGSSGIQGLQGTTGASGIQGLQGATGASGIQGFTGATGASGIQGLQGATGASGIQGLTGATGSSGIQGLQGATGASGLQGLQGSTGASGIQGLRGATGASGIQGLQGATGASGLQGLQGATGASGLQGLQGATGTSGPIGPSGATGPDFVYANDLFVSLPGTKTFGRYVNGDVIPATGKTPAQVIEMAIVEAINPTVNLTPNPTSLAFNTTAVNIILSYSFTILSLNASPSSAILEFKRANQSTWTTLSTGLTSTPGTFNHTFTDTPFNTQALNYRYIVTDTVGGSTTQTANTTIQNYSAPTGTLTLSGSVFTPETNVLREKGNIQTMMFGNINRNSVNVPITAYRIQSSVNDGDWSTFFTNTNVGPGSFSIPNFYNNPTGSSLAGKIAYRVLVDDIFQSNTQIFNTNNNTINFRNLIFYSVLGTPPTNSTQVRSLTGRGFAPIGTGNLENPFILNTGRIATNFTVAMPVPQTITLVEDLEVSNANITSQYVNNPFNVNDAFGYPTPYNVYTMTIAGPYSENHRHRITRA
jgi:hypothetical protein